MAHHGQYFVCVNEDRFKLKIKGDSICLCLSDAIEFLAKYEYESITQHDSYRLLAPWMRKLIHNAKIRTILTDAEMKQLQEAQEEDSSDCRWFDDMVHFRGYECDCFVDDLAPDNLGRSDAVTKFCEGIWKPISIISGQTVDAFFPLFACGPEAV